MVRSTGEARIASAKQVMQKGFLEVLHRHRVDMILIAVVAVMTIHALYCYSFSDSRLALAFSCVSVIVVAFAYLLIRALESRVRHRVEMAFLVGLISCGLLYSVVFAPGPFLTKPIISRRRTSSRTTSCCKDPPWIPCR